jgi:Raf kinase inhibitor-like YbhB/YbcL family protein
VPSRLSSAFLAAALLLGTAACSDDGRELAPLRSDQTTTSEPPPTIAGEDGVFTVASDAFADGGEIPVRYTCGGDGVSPALGWSHAPEAAELAVVVREREADGYVHWIVTGIDPTISSFAEAGVPEGAVEQANSTGAVGYDPPCPPPGSGRHAYEITLHALDAPLSIDESLPAAEVATSIETASSSEATFVGIITTVEETGG